jgi:hypothetical protein
MLSVPITKFDITEMKVLRLSGIFADRLQKCLMLFPKFLEQSSARLVKGKDSSVRLAVGSEGSEGTENGLGCSIVSRSFDGKCRAANTRFSFSGGVDNFYGFHRFAFGCPRSAPMWRDWDLNRRLRQRSAPLVNTDDLLSREYYALIGEHRAMHQAACGWTVVFCKASRIGVTTSEKYPFSNFLFRGRI